MADQSIAVKGNSKTVTGQVVGSDLLVQFELDIGCKVMIMADSICSGPGVIS